MSDTPTITVKQQPNWITIISVVLAIIFAFLFFRGCKGKDASTIVKVADSALIEENRRLLEQTTIDKQYKWKTDLLLTQREELEGVIVRQTKTIVTMERRLRDAAGQVIVVTDSADCIGLANQVNDYIDTAIKYRQLRDEQQAGYETAIMYEQLHSESLKRLLDSCRQVIGIVAPVVKLAKPRGVVYLGLGASTNLGFVLGGPELMYKDKRDRMYRVGYGVGNSNPWYSAGFYVPIKLKNQ